MSEIEIRPAKPDDLPFIYATWLKSYRTSQFAQNIESKIYFSWHHKIIESILTRSQVVIAHPTGQPNIIVGYLVTEPNVVHYCYVKFQFRKLGVATNLIQHQSIDPNQMQFTHATPDMNWIALKYPLLTNNYNPYAI
jgi:hypothetical protein